MSPAISSGWTSAPTRLALPTGALDVWRAPLDAPRRWARQLVSDEELARAERLVDEQGRERWVVSRAVLRALLGRYLGVEGRTLAFTLAEHGKPAAVQADVRFNLSHSDGVGLYAFCRHYEVGVDVEHESRVRDPLAVARRILGEREEQRLRSLDFAARNREFLRSWVRHEAITKCLGTGIAGQPLTDRQLEVVELDVGPGAAGAVAVAGPSLELRLFDWSS